MNIYDILRIVFPVFTNIVIVCVLVISIQYIKHDKRRSVFVNPLLSWSIHAFVFYCFTLTRYLFITLEPSAALSLWSSILRFHGALSVFVLIYNLRLMNGHEKEIYINQGKDKAYSEVVKILEKRLRIEAILED